jgi:hypothetical protein
MSAPAAPKAEQDSKAVHLLPSNRTSSTNKTYGGNLGKVRKALNNNNNNNNYDNINYEGPVPLMRQLISNRNYIGTTISTNIRQRVTVNREHLRRKHTPIGKSRTGTLVQKKSKYSSSSMYFCPRSPNGQRSLLPKRHSKESDITSTRGTLNENIKAWILCTRNFVPKSRKRTVNLSTPSLKHGKIDPPKGRRWPTVLLPSFKPKLHNYYEPLHEFTHHEEIDMARDKVQAAAQMRVRMGKLRSGFLQPISPSPGRGGGRGGGIYGRGDAEQITRSANGSTEGSTNKEPSNDKDSSITVTATDDVSTNKNEETQTISDLTGLTYENNNEMDEDEDPLAPTLAGGIPSNIEKFTPNTQWIKDLPKNLPKRRYGIEVKVSPAKTPSPTELPPMYNHARIFKAIITAILTAAPGTGICSINDDEEMIVNVDDIPSSQTRIDNYLDSPIVNTKTFTYHARIYISCIKPLFIIMKNEAFMNWLQKHRIFLEENDLETTLPATVGLVFFVHPRSSLMDLYQKQFEAMFIGKPVPDFKVRRFLLKCGKERAHVLIIQAVPAKANDVMRQFDEVNELNPYEYISWKNWNNFHINNKEVTIEAHNIYLEDHKVINLPGFIDDGSVQLGKIKKEKNDIDYSEYTLNEFLCSHYIIEDNENPVFLAAMGPFLGRRLFLTTSKLESAGKRLLDYVKSDMLRYMTTEAGRNILPDYNEHARKAPTTVWKPTWFEKQIVARAKQAETTEEKPQGKRKKIQMENSPTKPKQDLIDTYHKRAQQATKVLSEAAMTNEEKRMLKLEQFVASLQEDNVELNQTIGEMKNIQYQDQIKLVALQSELETANRRIESTSQEVKKCNSALITVEKKLATLSTADATNSRFDRIESMLSGFLTTTPNNNNTGMITLTGKRKELLMEGEHTENDDIADSQQIMETEYYEHQETSSNSREGRNDHTNSSTATSTSSPPVK